VTGKAALALAAREVVDESYATSVRELRSNFVAENGARGGVADLFDVAPAEAAREHPYELPAFGRRQFGELEASVGTEDQGAHAKVS
jgi:hypothetical protein